MKRCVQCNRQYEADGEYCPFDGGVLVAVTTDPLVGRTLDGKYRIDAKISAGGMGTVYRATHILMDHTCAVKVMHDSMLTDPAAISRFQREAKAAARIRHQNAIAVTDFGITSDQVVYLVMEYFDGRSLRNVLDQSGPLGPQRTAEILERAASALSVAHGLGIIHRDLKPDNIMVRVTPEGDEEVKVLDFGIAKLKGVTGGTEQLTVTGTVIGTPNYFSPEQCRAMELDARSDIYSLGIVAYELLSGTVPFTAETPLAVAMMHTVDQPPSLVERVPGLPREVEEVVMRALSKRPEDRPQSAVELAREFSAAVQGVSVDELEWRSVTPSRGKTGIVGGPTSGHPRAMTPRPTSQQARPAGTTALGSGHVPLPTSVVGSPPVTKRRSVLPWAGAALAAVVLVGGAIYYFAAGEREEAPQPISQAPEPPRPPEPPPGMVLIPGGTFEMGRNSGDPAEGPPHPVSVSAFFLDRTEVTNEQYAAFLREKGHAPPATWKDGTYRAGTGDFPVTDVSWLDARAYAQWAGKRLPTEAEWEFAARGTDGRLFPWGNDPRPDAALTKETGIRMQQPVGSMPGGVSPFGAFDMIGNVWEWCEDGFKLYPGSTFEVKPSEQMYKIVRGGCFESDQGEINAVTRFWYDPAKPDHRIGFRCAKSVE
jgi:serine/threonine-protein kinase